MNDRTGEIRQMDAEMVAELNRLADKLAGQWVPIPDEQLGNVQGMNRAQRRAWAKEQRKGGKR